MGLFDELGGLAGKLFSGGDQNKLLESVMGLINNSEAGGLAGLARTFQEKGLGDAISSWIGTGKNLPISGDQITAALGEDQVQRIAEHSGLSREEASQGLAGLLPEIIDKLTPNGNMPEGDMRAQGAAMLKDRLFRA